MYLLRLDDASEYMNVQNWAHIESILDKYNIKPIVAVIPNNQDPSFIDNYKKDDKFWAKVKEWNSKGWIIALHGFNHVYLTNSGGINPVNSRSEFAGLPFQMQCEKIRDGNEIFRKHNISPRIFVAPSHTFDLNTLSAIKQESDIRIISDTFAYDIYRKWDLYFIPQQASYVQWLPFKLTTFCYHPNNMDENSFKNLELFIIKHRKLFIDFDDITLKSRKLNLIEISMRKLYFLFRFFRTMLKTN